MQIKCWGTRGSLPSPMTKSQFIKRLHDFKAVADKRGIVSTDKFLELLESETELGPLCYGGNTTCTEVRHKDLSIYIDMGSGLRSASTEAMKSGQKVFHIFQTHMHWDHIMGMPYLIPIYSKNSTINIYHVHKNAPEALRINFNGTNFPLKWDQLEADIQFHQLTLYQGTKIEDLKITPFTLDHPGGCFGYHIQSSDRRIAIGVDGEFKRQTSEQLGKDRPFYQDLDALVFDAQYEIDELASRHDWGHSSPNIGVDIALRERIKKLVLTHHDPWANEDRLLRMYQTAVAHCDKKWPSHQNAWKDFGSKAPEVIMAYDGLTIDL